MQREEELASDFSGDSDDDESENEEPVAEARPEDKENLQPKDASDKASSERPKVQAGRKRKRQTAERALRKARETESSRRQRIRQYYNGASHGSASAVQLFAMAMQVSSAQWQIVVDASRL